MGRQNSAPNQLFVQVNLQHWRFDNTFLHILLDWIQINTRHTFNCDLSRRINLTLFPHRLFLRTALNFWLHLWILVLVNTLGYSFHSVMLCLFERKILIANSVNFRRLLNLYSENLQILWSSSLLFLCFIHRMIHFGRLNLWARILAWHQRVYQTATMLVGENELIYHLRRSEGSLQNMTILVFIVLQELSHVDVGILMGNSFGGSDLLIRHDQHLLLLF